MNKNEFSTKAINDYTLALEELIKNNEKITFDAVSIKAGRGKGAIKGNSPEILQLREKIIKAKTAQKESKLIKHPQYQITQALRIKNNYRARYNELKYEYDAQATQILSLLAELADTQLELRMVLQKLNNLQNFKK